MESGAPRMLNKDNRRYLKYQYPNSSQTEELAAARSQRCKVEWTRQV